MATKAKKRAKPAAVKPKQVQRADAATPEDRYDVIRTRQARLMKAASDAGRDIAPLPDVVNPERRAASVKDFQTFAETYFALVFYMPWSADHLKIIRKIHWAVIGGDLFAHAMPRGSGKTSLVEVAAMWAAMCGHCKFVVIIGAEEASAQERLESIKSELGTNEMLLEDFPEICYPIRRLEGISHRASGQTFEGVRTHISISGKELILPTIAGAGGAILTATGLTGRIRGMKHKRADGTGVRPDLVLLDDPQSDDSSRSPSQCAAREALVAGAVLGMAGPGKKIAAVMPCTVIRAGDMASRMLDRKLHPQWQGEITKLVYAFPKNDKLWEQYAEVRRESFRKGGTGAEATEFYRANRVAMDEGSAVAWAERFNPDELSALQCAMNLKLRDEPAFWAEYQNEPKTDAGEATDLPSADDIASKLSGIPQGVVPLNAAHVTAFIDIQKTLLYYAVCAWAEDFTGWVIDYGAYPEQGTEYWLLREAKSTLGAAMPAAGVEGAIYAGLEALTAKLLGKAWRRDDGASMSVDRCLIDANWGTSTNLVYDFCRASPHAAVLMPSHGRFIGASSLPMNQWSKKPGDRQGLGWQIQGTLGKRVIRHVTFDGNFWKSFVFSRLSTPMGDAGCLSLFGNRPGRHRMIADHLTAEYCVLTQGRGRTVSEWKQRPERPDNHLLDCCHGAAVAASMQGAGLRQAERKGVVDAPKKRISLAAIQAAKRGY